MFAYHVVTDRPMYVGQQIVFDETHHSGVYQRAYDKIDIVNDICTNPSEYDAETLEHHTSVALRELALEEVRQKKYPQYPSRMSCLYVSKTFEEAENWGKFFAEIDRPLAELYWKNKVDDTSQQAIYEMLVDGQITVVEIVKEINANI